MTDEEAPTFGGVTPSQGGWILVLSDHTHVRNLLLRVLSRAGYAVLGCATLSEAEPVLRRFASPGLILFDGAEASEEMLPPRLQRLSTLLPPAEAGCPVLVLSAMHPLPRAQFLPGMVRVVAKPFNLAHVLHLVARQMAPLKE